MSRLNSVAELEGLGQPFGIGMSLLQPLVLTLHTTKYSALSSPQLSPLSWEAYRLSMPVMLLQTTTHSGLPLALQSWWWLEVAILFWGHSWERDL